MADPLPAWVELYAARLLERFPEVFLALGDPDMGETFQLPPQTDLVESETETIVRTNLRRRAHPGCMPTVLYNGRPCWHGQADPLGSDGPSWEAPRFLDSSCSMLGGQRLQNQLGVLPGCGFTPCFTMDARLPAERAPTADWASYEHTITQVHPSVEPSRGTFGGQCEQRDSEIPSWPHIISADTGIEGPLSAARVPLAQTRKEEPSTEGSLATTAQAGASEAFLASRAQAATHFKVQNSLQDERRRGAARGLAQRRGVAAALHLKVQPAPRESSAESIRSRGAASGASSGEADRLRPTRRCSLERVNPAVQLLHRRSAAATPKSMRSTVAVLQRPLPASFPLCKTVFFMDWDDTLCPTSWIATVLKNRMAGLQDWMEGYSPADEWLHSIPAWFSLPLPDDPRVKEMIDELQQIVIDVITVAQTFGVVCIVTNAVPGWVEKTVKKWLPQLVPYMFGHGALPPIKIVYGQKVFHRPAMEAATLPFVDDLGELMLWKRVAMTEVLDNVDELYRLTDLPMSPSRPSTQSHCSPAVSWCLGSRPNHHVTNIISMGDNEAEMQATGLAVRCSRAAQGHASSPTSLGPGKETSRPLSAEPSHKLPAVKLVKLLDVPHIQQICAQLEKVVDMMPRLVAAQTGFRIDLGDPLSGQKVRRPKPRQLHTSDAEVKQKLLSMASRQTV